MITWLDMWIMQIWAANKITMAIYVASNYLVAIIWLFTQRQTSNFTVHQSVVCMFSLSSLFPYFTPLTMMSWCAPDTTLHWASFKCWGDDKKVQRRLTTSSKTTCHCWVRRIFKKCCQSFPSVTWGAYGWLRWPRLCHSPITTHESEQNKQNLKCCSLQEKNVDRTLCTVWLTNYDICRKLH